MLHHHGNLIELLALIWGRGQYDGGIFGSPDTKDEIQESELRLGNMRSRAFLLGHSLYDYEASKRVGQDFIFVSGWSEVTEDCFPEFENSTHAERLNSLIEKRLPGQISSNTD